MLFALIKELCDGRRLVSRLAVSVVSAVNDERGQRNFSDWHPSP